MRITVPVRRRGADRDIAGADLLGPLAQPRALVLISGLLRELSEKGVWVS
jgi:hypothetical protein